MMSKTYLMGQKWMGIPKMDGNTKMDGYDISQFGAIGITIFDLV